MKPFQYLNAFNSPFIRPSIKFYFGKIAIGTPYFYPRRWIKSKEKEGYLTAVPKKIGFDFVDLGWKTKWSDTDYRFEWAPLISFVFFKWQFAILFDVPHTSHYWEAWLYYENNTDKTTTDFERIQTCKSEFPIVYTVWNGDGTKERVDFYSKILKTKFI